MEWKGYTYTWRGKTYKTINGFCRAVLRVHSGAAVSFGETEMLVRWPTGPSYVYDVVRKSDGAEISERHK
jgi:hypothetical protein